MLRSLFGFNWRKSNAHLLLLSKFLRPRTIDAFTGSDGWKAVLRESPQKAIKRFMDDGVLIQAHLSSQLDYKFKVAELKVMLKQRGLAVSGRKEDLINRLIQADSEGMEKAVAGLRIFLCSEHGKEIAEQYLSSENAKKDELEKQVFQYLEHRKFKQASLSVAAYESGQVFPRGIGIDWKSHDSARDIEILNSIFGNKPKILSQLKDEHLAALRLAAGMISLLGTNEVDKWLPPNFETGLAMGNDAAARMFLFYASYQADIANYRQSGVVKQVEILATKDSCGACKKISGKRYKLSEVPELPYEHCTHEMGCRCTVAAIVK